MPSNEDNTYNGWANYETWNVELWLSNEEPLYEIVREFVNRAEGDTYKLSLRIRNFVFGEFDRDGKFGDIDERKELSRVHWHDIAAAWQEE